MSSVGSYMTRIKVSSHYTILRRTRSTYKHILRGLASGGIDPLEQNYTTIMFRTEDTVQESTGKRGLYRVQERHTECHELSSYRSMKSAA